MGRETVKLPSMEAPKKESNKALWATLITGVVSLATAVSVAIIQTGSASQEDMDKINKQNTTSFTVVMTQINDKILPRIERNQELQGKKLDRLAVRLLEEIAYLRERVARLEERNGIREPRTITRIFRPPAIFSSEEPDEEDEPEAPLPEDQPQKIPRLSF
jgi:uncharacterized protein HemX